MTSAAQQPPSPRIGDLSPDRTRHWNGDIWGWQSLWLVPDAVVAVARDRFGLVATGATFLASGLLNQTWHIETDHGPSILRVSRLERSRPQIAYEHTVLRALHEQMAEVVAPLPGVDGGTIQHADGLLISLFPFVAGISGSETAATIRAHAAAVALARIHQYTSERLHLRQRLGFHSVDQRPRWVWPDVKPTLARALAGSPEFAHLSEAIEEEIARLDDWLDALAATGRLVPRTVVHSDFNPRNLIFQGARLAAIIDWDDCHIEPVVWEVAQVAFAPDVDPHAFWQTYRDAGGPLPEQDVALLGGFACIGALSELRWTLDEHDRATPHALQQLREVVRNLAWLRGREAALSAS